MTYWDVFTIEVYRAAECNSKTYYYTEMIFRWANSTMIFNTRIRVPQNLSDRKLKDYIFNAINIDKTGMTRRKQGTMVEIKNSIIWQKNDLRVVAIYQGVEQSFS